MFEQGYLELLAGYREAPEEATSSRRDADVGIFQHWHFFLFFCLHSKRFAS